MYTSAYPVPPLLFPRLLGGFHIVAGHGVGVGPRSGGRDRRRPGAQDQPAALGHRIPGIHGEIHDDLLDLAALMAAAQMLGAADRMLALATDYAKIRQQFGQPIGAFQAVKHILASTCVRVEFAKPVLLRAAFACCSAVSTS